MMKETWDEVDVLWRKLQETDPGTEEHSRVLDDIGKIVGIQDKLYARIEPSLVQQILVSPAFIGGVIQFGALLVLLNFEKLDTVTSRAFGWIRFR